MTSWKRNDSFIHERRYPTVEHIKIFILRGKKVAALHDQKCLPRFSKKIILFEDFTRMIFSFYFSNIHSVDSNIGYCCFDLTLLDLVVLNTFNTWLQTWLSCDDQKRKAAKDHLCVFLVQNSCSDLIPFVFVVDIQCLLSAKINWNKFKMAIAY